MEKRPLAAIGPSYPPSKIGWVSTLIIEVLRGVGNSDIILITDKDKPLPKYKKLPGGKRDIPSLGDGTRMWSKEPWPEQTLYREVREEIKGLPLPSQEELTRFYGEGPIYEEEIFRRNRSNNFFYTWALQISEDEVENITPGDEIEKIYRIPMYQMKYEILGKGKILPRKPSEVSRGALAKDLVSDHEMALFIYVIRRAQEDGDNDFLRHIQEEIAWGALPEHKADRLAHILNGYK